MGTLERVTSKQILRNFPQVYEISWSWVHWKYLGFRHLSSLMVNIQRERGSRCAEYFEHLRKVVGFPPTYKKLYL